MAHLTKMKERVDHVVAVRPLAHPLHVMFSLPVDQSMMVTEVIVPSAKHERGETVLITVGDSSPGAEIKRWVTIPLDIMMHRCSRHRSKCWPDECHDRAMAEELLSFAPGRLGHRLAEPIPIPPRMLVMVESSEGSAITVWLRGLISRDL